MFAGKIVLRERKVRDIATRSRQPHDKASAEGVSSPREDNRNDRCPLLCCENGCGSRGNDAIDFLPDELGNHLGCALAASLTPSNLSLDPATLDPSWFA